MSEEDEDGRRGNRFKDNAGVATAMLVVVAFIGSGYTSAVSGAVLTRPLTFSDVWQSAMLSLASAAIGYLFGRGRSSSGGYSQADLDAALATPPPGLPRRAPPCDDPPCPDAPPPPLDVAPMPPERPEGKS